MFKENFTNIKNENSEKATNPDKAKDLETKNIIPKDIGEFLTKNKDEGYWQNC